MLFTIKILTQKNQEAKKEKKISKFPRPGSDWFSSIQLLHLVLPVVGILPPTPIYNSTNQDSTSLYKMCNIVIKILYFRIRILPFMYDSTEKIVST